MKEEKKEIERLLKSAQDYFGKDEKIYIYLNVVNVTN